MCMEYFLDAWGPQDKPASWTKELETIREDSKISVNVKYEYCKVFPFLTWQIVASAKDNVVPKQYIQAVVLKALSSISHLKGLLKCTWLPPSFWFNRSGVKPQNLYF